MSDHAQWLRRFEEKLRALPQEQRQRSSISILHQFNRPLPAQDSAFGCERFIAAVRRLPIGPTVPHLTESYIHKYLEDMRRLKLIGPP
jgi:fatty acid CoA ligase FadD9